eukprot:4545009-Amphidinium_carterae.1
MRNHADKLCSSLPTLHVSQVLMIGLKAVRFGVTLSFIILKVVVGEEECPVAIKGIPTAPRQGDRKDSERVQSCPLVKRQHFPMSVMFLVLLGGAFSLFSRLPK